SIAGRLPGGSDAANEIPAERAERAGLDYLALGDWHGALRIAPRTWYSGTPEPDRHKDNQAGCVQLVHLAGRAEPPKGETIPVGHFAWVRREVELVDGGCEGVVTALETLPAEDRRCVVALAIRGVVSLSGRRRLQQLLSARAARLHHLEVDDASLVDELTA